MLCGSPCGGIEAMAADTRLPCSQVTQIRKRTLTWKYGYVSTADIIMDKTGEDDIRSVDDLPI
jgi:hypothetical protein